MVRDCDSSTNGIFWPDARKTCKDKTQKEDLKSCAAFCTTEFCNNYTSNPFNFTIPKTSSNPTIFPGTATCVLGPVVQWWVSANPGLKFNPLFWFVYFYTSVYFKTLDCELL